MGRIVGSFTAALIGATIVLMCAAEPVLAGPAAMLAQQNEPITAGDAAKAGTLPPPPPYNPKQVQYVDPGMPTPEPPGPGTTPTPTPTAAPTPRPLPQVKIEGVRTDRVPTPGQLLFDKTRAIAFDDPFNWSVTIFKKRHQLIVYYKSRLFKSYHAVFGRSFEPGTKLWEGDRRTPEGVYAIIDKHPSARWDWFLTLNYPNDLDRHRYEQMRDDGEVPHEDGHPVGVGGRIGIHGTDEPELNRGDINWTTGCISVEDEDIEELTRLLPKGTLVIINP
ncbi:MAG: L,D-transpeptidase [Candidatus Binatus sp.]|uniref:L,D-transpeptidase family protein n=1 Tax=Candidatus Binatus sp. TaxID=2811406 RepID=UPI003BAF3A06